MIVSKGTPLRKNDKILPNGDIRRRVQKWDVLSKKAFPTQTLAQRELDKIVSAANGKTLVLPPDLRAIEVVLCESCRKRLIAALSVGK